MILIADSGSTKTDWRLLGPERQEAAVATAGINPNYQDSAAIRADVEAHLLPGLAGARPQKVYFYGAGCSTEAKCAVVRQPLQQLFPEAGVRVMSDVVAAARGACGHEKGIAVILGTGSNTCLFDGEKIISQMPCLGFTLGNEGSGSYLGKKLLSLYLNNELPADLHNAFRAKHPETQAEILQHVYNEPFPNRYIAGFARFLAEHQDHPFVRGLVYDSFREFFRLTICKYPDYRETPANFVGSIAFHFSDVLQQAAADVQIRVGRILSSPMEGLLQYHREQLLN